MNEDDRTSAERWTAAEEAALVDSARRGDRRAMESLLRSYQHRVFSVCYRMLGRTEDAADITQDTLTKLLTSLDRYDGRAALSTWVYRIAVNACLSYRRKRRTIDRIEAGETALNGYSAGAAVAPAMDREIAGEPHGFDRVQQGEEKRTALEALKRIPDEARALLILRDVRGLDYRQIADVLDTPVGTVKSRLFRARLLLRGELERLGETGGSDEPGPGPGERFPVASRGAAGARQERD